MVTHLLERILIYNCPGEEMKTQSQQKFFIKYTFTIFIFLKILIYPISAHIVL